MASFVQIVLLASCFVNSLKALEPRRHGDYHRSKRGIGKRKGNTIIGLKYSNKTLAHFNRMNIEKLETGVLTPNHRIFYHSVRGPISPLHDIPLYSDYNKLIVNMVVETPAWTNVKMAINLNESLNPISRGTRRGGYIWNYGALPQTWQNPYKNDTFTGQKGDGSPLDVIDLGEKPYEAGDIIQVKVLAAIGLNYEGKTDWKILTIQVDDPEESKTHNLADVESLFPTMIETTVNYYKYWFPRRNITLFEEAKEKEFAYKVIADCNKQWIELIEGKVKPSPGMSLLNTYIKGSEGKISYERAQEELEKNQHPSGRPTTVWGMYDDPYALTTSYILTRPPDRY